MQDKDKKMIWESYVTGREYGPSGAPSINVSEWKLDAHYHLSEWDEVSGDDNPFNQHVHAVKSDLQAKIELTDDTKACVIFFGPPQGTTDYENWTDPSIVVALASVSDDGYSDETYSKGVFVDNDGAGESHQISDQQLAELIKNNQREIKHELTKDDEPSYDNPYGRDGVVDRSDFY